MLLRKRKTWRASNSKAFIHDFGLYSEWYDLVGQPEGISFDEWEPGMFFADEDLIAEILKRMEGTFFIDYNEEFGYFLIHSFDYPGLEERIGKLEEGQKSLLSGVGGSNEHDRSQ